MEKIGGLALNETVQYLVMNIARLCIRERIAILSLEIYILEQGCEFEKLQEIYNWQHAGAKLQM